MVIFEELGQKELGAEDFKVTLKQNKKKMIDVIGHIRERFYRGKQMY
jgi:hypothetical protein